MNTHSAAPISRRLGALIYESLLVIAISFVPLMFAAIITTMLHSIPLLSNIIAAIGLLVAWRLYFHFAWLKGGQTLPMRVWRLKLENQQGTILNKRQAWIRFFWCVIFLAVLPLSAYYIIRLFGLTPLISFELAILWYLLPWGYAYFDPDKQFLYDRLSGTRLVLLPKK